MRDIFTRGMRWLWYNVRMGKALAKVGIGCWIRRILILLTVLWSLWLALPFLLSWVDFPMMTFELPHEFVAKLPAAVTNRTVTAKVDVGHCRGLCLDLKIRGRILDWPYTIRSEIAYVLLPWRGGATCDLRLDGSPWHIAGSAFGSLRNWKANAKIESPTHLREDEPLLASLIAKFAPSSVSNVVVTGSLAAAFRAEKTRELPVVAWSAKGRLADFGASCLLNDKPLEIRRLSTIFGVDGIADRTTIRPFCPRIDAAEYNGVSVTNFSASVLMTENSLLVTEAGAGFCGGEVKLYSLYLNPKSLTTGFTLFLDGIDTNEIVGHLKGFSGSATGRLHGKIPVFLKNGCELRLKNSYLYSVPGETGTICFDDASPVLDSLASGGVDECTTSNLAKALANLSYKSLKFDLKREDDGEGLALAMAIDGTATHGTTTVPVTFAVTLHGDLEQLINTGLRMK